MKFRLYKIKPCLFPALKSHFFLNEILQRTRNRGIFRHFSFTLLQKKCQIEKIYTRIVLQKGICYNA